MAKVFFFFSIVFSSRSVVYCFLLLYLYYLIFWWIHLLVEFKIRHQRLVLEDRRHSNGDQSCEASSAEKYSNWRSVKYFPRVYFLESNLEMHKTFPPPTPPLQVLLTHRSVSDVSRGHSAERQAPPPVISALRTPSLVTEPVPALHVTPALSMQVPLCFTVRHQTPKHQKAALIFIGIGHFSW